jgi:hypothetical protein
MWGSLPRVIFFRFDCLVQLRHSNPGTLCLQGTRRPGTSWLALHCSPSKVDGGSHSRVVVVSVRFPVEAPLDRLPLV